MNVYFSVGMCAASKSMLAKYVLHVNSPTWGQANAQKLLSEAVANILKHADDKNLKTVALPSISSGK